MQRPYPPISPRCRRICVVPKRARFSGRTSTGGRRLERGNGVLDLGAVHRDAVATLLENAADGAEAARINRDAWTFFAETVAPVEMCLRGYQQSNDSLRKLAATLDEQVRERTRDLDESLEELRRADEARKLLLERLVSAQEDERRRIAGDIHDDSIQVITAAYLRVELIRQTLGDDAAFGLARQARRGAAGLDRAAAAHDLRAAPDDARHGGPLSHDPGAPRPVDPPDRGHLHALHAPGARARAARSHHPLPDRRGGASRTFASTPGRRHVSVDLAHEASGYLLRVADDGVGSRAPGHDGSG